MNNNLIVALIISGPSGSGKSSLTKKILAHDTKFKLTISHTTRAPRQGEAHGVEYHFIDAKSFGLMQAQNEFLECVEMYGNSYGTHKSSVQECLNMGQSLIFDVDPRGSEAIKKYFGSLNGQGSGVHIMDMYIMPPSIDILRQRLEARGDTEESIKRRTMQAEKEMQYAANYTHKIVNDDLERAFDQIKGILSAPIILNV